MKGDIPVAELTSELWAYSTHGRWEDRETGRLHSAGRIPSPGWPVPSEPEDRVTETPRA